jgi:hypothetical protein
MAELIDRSGNIFTTSCEVVTLTVNCEGFMGAGIALDGRLRWPQMFEQYAARCASGQMRPGVLDWWGPDARGHRVLCFPTKASWKHPSRIEFVTEGLAALASEYTIQGVASIAMPHLGCSHGGLTWQQVRPLIAEALEPLKELTVELWEFNPQASDPDYDVLADLLTNRPPTEVGNRLNLDARGVNALIAAAGSPRVVNLASLQNAPGVGEKTLEKVYDFLFRSNDEHQQALW